MADKTLGADNKPSRRDFLRSSAKGALGMLGVSTLGKIYPQKEALSEIRADESLIGVTVRYSESGMPREYEVNGQIHIFSEKETADMANAIQKAKAEKIPQLLCNIRGDPIPNSYVSDPEWHPTPDRPFVKEIPNHLSEEVLKANGLEIVQGERIELYITDSALREGGELYKLSQDQKNENRLKLKIIIVDKSPFLSPTFMPAGYEYLAPPLKNDPEVYRQTQIDNLQKQIQLLVSQPSSQSRQSQIVDLEKQIGDWSTADDLEIELAGKENRFISYYIPASYGVDKSGERVANLLLAVGEMPPERYHLNILTDENGSIFLEQSSGLQWDMFGDLSPREYTGFPRMSDYTRLQNAGVDGGYEYAGGLHQPGQALKHEMGHMDTTDLGNGSQNTESAADQAFAKHTEEESEQWLKNGINIFPFVFVDLKTGAKQVTKRQPRHVVRQH